MGTSGVVGVIALVAIVSLVVVVGIYRHRKKAPKEEKTPTSTPLPTRIVNFQPRPAALVQDSKIV